MTTTNVFQGMDTGAKPSSRRVLAPPGGSSSNIFGGPEPVRAAGVTPSKTTRSEGFCYGSDPSRPPQEMMRSQEPSSQPPHKSNPESTIQAMEPAVSFAEQNYQKNAQSGDRIFGAGPVDNGRSGKAADGTNCTFNPITGLWTGEKRVGDFDQFRKPSPAPGAYNPITGQAEAQEPPTNRVRRQPPGGFSQPLW